MVQPHKKQRINFRKIRLGIDLALAVLAANTSKRSWWLEEGDDILKAQYLEYKRQFPNYSDRAICEYLYQNPPWSKRNTGVKGLQNRLCKLQNKICQHSTGSE